MVVGHIQGSEVDRSREAGGSATTSGWREITLSDHYAGATLVPPWCQPSSDPTLKVYVVAGSMATLGQ